VYAVGARLVVLAMSFVAKYPGNCAECGRTFQPGDEVEYRTVEGLPGSQIVALHDHTESALLDEVGHKPAGVCPQCFLVHVGDCF
jgi:hypothetical protein